MDKTSIITTIEAGQTYLGIELGSTRMKSVLILPDGEPVASGSFTWENRYENGIWTYHQDEIWTGLQSCYCKLLEDVQEQFGVTLRTIGALGISAMMHGYLPFDQDGQMLTPFRTWRNTITAQASAELTKLFNFNIPQRWSIAHLYQAILNREEHTGRVAFLTTLAGYVHWQLTGERVLGVGEASGMFPIDSSTLDFDPSMLEKFQAAASSLGWQGSIRNILPRVLQAGENAGCLTAAGAHLLDPSGNLRPGIPAAPPEGDAGTGMAATNSVSVRTGNVSAGTSIFSMVVLEKPLNRMYEQIDMVTTPAGAPVAMVHCNNCTNELNTWAAVFQELLERAGKTTELAELFPLMYSAAMEGETDCGGLLLYNYLSGEPVTGFSEGRPLLVRTPEARLTFANLMRTQLYSAVATLRLGMDILTGEGVRIDGLFGHGGFFKTPEVGQRMMAGALGVPISVMETAGESGAWGMALLAAYCQEKDHAESLEHYLKNKIFVGHKVLTQEPHPEDVSGFAAFLQRYTAGLPIEHAAVQQL